ncbi:MAG: hypothetical protein ACOYIP_01970 [Coriobacteriales bacterium]|jgi:hypothetical protein
MKLKKLPYELTVCEVATLDEVDPHCDFLIAAQAENGISVVCPSADVPAMAAVLADGLRGFAFQNEDRSPAGGKVQELGDVLSRAKVSALGACSFSIGCALVKPEDLDRAEAALVAAGYSIA